MNALSFVFRPVSAAVLNFAHLMALLLAVGGVFAATRPKRRLAAVMLLAALGWLANVGISVTLAAGALPAGAFAWAQFAGDLPVWAAVVVGLAGVWR
jgi:hypothetical protein